MVPDEFDMSATVNLQPSRLEYLQTLQLVEFSLAQLDETPLEIEGRISAAHTLAERGELISAMDLLRESLVLIKTMVELHSQGRRHDLLDMRIEAHIRKHLAQLDAPGVDPDALAETARGVAREAIDTALTGEAFRAAVRQLLEQRVAELLQQGAFKQAVQRQIDRALQRHLEQEAFTRAAAAAAARYPDGLLKRPETISRIEAVAVERDRALLESSRLGDMLGALVDRHTGDMIDDPRLEARIELLADRHLQSWLSSSQARSRLPLDDQPPPADPAPPALDPEELAATIDERVDALLGGDALSAAVEQRLRDHPGVGRALEDRLRDSEPFADLLEQRSRKLLGRTEFTHRVDHLIRQRCEMLLESNGFRKAVDKRVGEGAQEPLAELEQRLLRTLEQRLAAVAKQQRELEQRIDLQKRIDEQVTELVRKTVGREVRTLTESLVPEQVKASLTENEQVEAELTRLVDDAVRKGIPEQKVNRLVLKELANREALRNAELSGDGLVDHATALARSEAIAAVIEEHLTAFKQREVAKAKQRKSSGASQAPSRPPSDSKAPGKGKTKTPLDQRSTGKVGKKPPRKPDRKA